MQGCAEHGGTNLGYCTVTAPISGYISDAKIKVGNVISGSVQPVALADIYDNTELSAVFEIEDSQYETMVASMNGEDGNLYKAIPLKFRDALPHSYTADLSYEAPSVNQSTGTILLKGKVKNIDNELKDGMYVTVSLPYGANPKSVLIKDASIGTDQLGKYVYVVNDSNKVVYTPIELGEVFQDSLRVIDKGILPGMKYVSKALLTVREGETVKPIVKNKNCYEAMFSKFFIDRPIFATVLALLLVFAGILTVKTLLKWLNIRDITPPTVMVSADYPGADAETVARAIGVPIEEQVNGVDNMLYMSSNCGADGSYMLTITFENGTYVDQAAVDVQNRVSRPRLSFRVP